MESVSEGGEGREGSEVKRGARVGEGERGSARVGEGRRAWPSVELSRHPFYINHEIFNI